MLSCRDICLKHVQGVGQQRAWWDVEPQSLRDGPEPEDGIPAALAAALFAITEEDDEDPAPHPDAEHATGIFLDQADDMVCLIHPCWCCRPLYLSLAC
jgi:hypothetical protein